MRALFIFLLLAASTAVACINDSDSIEENYEVYTGQSPMKFLREQMSTRPSQILGGLPSAPTNLPGMEVNFKDTERNAVWDIYAGNYGDVIEQLLALVRLRSITGRMT